MNELLRREGLARVLVFPPNTQYLDDFEAAEKKVKSEKKRYLDGLLIFKFQ